MYNCDFNMNRYYRLQCTVNRMLIDMERYRQIGSMTNVLTLNIQPELIHDAYNAVYNTTYKTLLPADCMNITCGMIAKIESMKNEGLSRAEIQGMEPTIPIGVLDIIMPYNNVWTGGAYSDYM